MPDIAEAADNVVALKPKTRGRTFAPVWLAVAASVVVGIFVVSRLGGPAGGSDPSLADQVLAHLDHEPYAWQVTSDQVPTSEVTGVMERADARVGGDLGLVSYARSCKINGQSVPHLVVQGENGPVTIMIMPQESISEAITLEDDRFHGTILPVGKDGSIAIIGRKGESIDDIRRRVDQSIGLSI